MIGFQFNFESNHLWNDNDDYLINQISMKQNLLNDKNLIQIDFVFIANGFNFRFVCQKKAKVYLKFLKFPIPSDYHDFFLIDVDDDDAEDDIASR
ncbi:hypothetical protein DERP_009506 [Dermatophagoides pteronyssinus]|uniref:Uncharacterized protein n=1 Tax=Dermatophagoides pteronyssinus TaxID=6956 RepID=A0ABQ8IUM4_DERPT|nr:hypothetical protein DERP_009506 [Dermatophagoides pteronyssinus]